MFSTTEDEIQLFNKYSNTPAVSKRCDQTGSHLCSGDILPNNGKNILFSKSNPEIVLSNFFHSMYNYFN